MFHFPHVLRSQRKGNATDSGCQIFPTSVAFVLVLVISRSQGGVSTTRLTPALPGWGNRRKGQGEGAGPTANSQHTFHVPHWPEPAYISIPSCKGGWEVPPSNIIRILMNKGKGILAKQLIVSATLGVHPWAIYLISLGIYNHICKGYLWE